MVRDWRATDAIGVGVGRPTGQYRERELDELGRDRLAGDAVGPGDPHRLGIAPGGAAVRSPVVGDRRHEHGGARDEDDAPFRPGAAGEPAAQCGGAASDDEVEPHLTLI
ncbi:MAG: hypothetical protein R2697_09400 [Ilumatobacteraceae bacterium]